MLMRDNPNVKALLDSLNPPGFDEPEQEYKSALDQIDELTDKYNAVMAEVTALREKLSEISDKKNPLTAMAERIHSEVSDIGEKLKAVKDKVLEFTKNTLDAIKEKGLSSLGAASDFLHIQDGLQSISNGLGKAAARCENLEKFHLERVESKLLTELEIPSNLESLSQDELTAAYDKLLEIGMEGNLSVAGNAVVQDLVEEIETLLPENDGIEPAPELELEQDAEM